MGNDPVFKSMLIYLLERGIQLIRLTISMNPQYAYELSDAIHNMPDWIDNPEAYIIKHQIFIALLMILDETRQTTKSNNFIGREGLGHYADQILKMDYAFEGHSFKGIYIGKELHTFPQRYFSA